MTVARMKSFKPGVSSPRDVCSATYAGLTSCALHTAARPGVTRGEGTRPACGTPHHIHVCAGEAPVRCQRRVVKTPPRQIIVSSGRIPAIAGAV
jgi:hypothetical protein